MFAVVSGDKGACLHGDFNVGNAGQWGDVLQGQIGQSPTPQLSVEDVIQVPRGDFLRVPYGSSALLLVFHGSEADLPTKGQMKTGRVKVVVESIHLAVLFLGQCHPVCGS